MERQSYYIGDGIHLVRYQPYYIYIFSGWGKGNVSTHG